MPASRAAAPRPGARPAGGGILGDKPGAAGGGGGAAKPITIIEEGRGAKSGGKAGLGELDNEDDVPVVVAAAAGAGGGRGGMKGGGGQGVLVQDIMAAQQQVKVGDGRSPLCPLQFKKIDANTRHGVIALLVGVG